MKERDPSGEVKDGTLIPRMFCPNVSIIGEVKMSGAEVFLKRKCIVCSIVLKS